MSKLEEQATAKAELSYSYWAANAAASAPAPQPKQLTNDEARRLQAKQMERAASSGASAWNHAGTWEERDVTTAAKNALSEMLTGAAGEAVDGCAAHITDVIAGNGEAVQFSVRGKLRASFEFELTLKWSVTLDTDVVATGTLTVPNACHDELDELQSEIKVDAGTCNDDAALVGKARASVKALMPVILVKLEELLPRIQQLGSSK